MSDLPTLLDINDVVTEPANLRAPDTIGISKAIGRKAALQCLDSLLLEENNIQSLRIALQETFDASPSAFFKHFVMPLIPRESDAAKSEETMRPLQIILVDASSRDRPAPQPVLEVPDNESSPFLEAAKVTESAEALARPLSLRNTLLTQSLQPQLVLLDKK